MLTQVVEARAKVAQMNLPENVLTNPRRSNLPAIPGAQLTAALSRLMVVVENVIRS